MEHNFTWKNDGRTKVMIGCGTRPEIIRLAAVIKRCREYFDCCVVYYNQNWDRNLSTVFWEDFELKNTFGEYGPDILVPVVGENLGVTCGNILGRSYELLSELQPEGYLVLGDTNSCLSAISAKRLHIPLPDEEARRAMFRIHFGKEGHSLTDQDYADLAAKTDGFSGSDISGMVKQALMIPVKRIQKAEYFFIGKDNMYHPCGPNTFVGYERWSEA